jgi:DNA-binding MarR family transcriptional regulator
MTIEKSITHINENWTDIYHHLHYVHHENISHQAIRVLQCIEKKSETTIGDLAAYLQVSHNTASEHIKRLIAKELVSKQRSPKDERKVLVVLTEKGTNILYRHTRLDTEKLKKLLESMEATEVKAIEKAFSLLSEEAKKCF